MRPIILFFCCLSTFFLSAQESKEEQKPIIFILDASGSMWGKIGEETKIILARKVLNELVGKFADEQAIGLVAYGHRRKGDCEDVEYILPPAAGNKEAFIQKLAKIKPLGKTPLAISAKLVIDRLRSEKQAAKVILISDGIETCSGDLCALARDAKSEGIDFVLHIIGFDLADSEREALQCAAEASGGQYIDAADGAQLAEALETASEVSEVEEEGPVTISVLCTQDGKLLDVVIKVYDKNTGKQIKVVRSYDHEEKNPAMISLPPGTYDIEGRPVGEIADFTLHRKGVVIKEGQIVKDTFDYSMGAVSILCMQNGKKVDVGLKVYQSGTKKSVAGKRSYTGPKSNPATIKVPPGTYDVEAGLVGKKGIQDLRITNVRIAPNAIVKDTFDFTTGKISVKATENGQLMDATVWIYQTSNKKNSSGGRTYNSEKTNPLIRDLSPGLYDVTVKSTKIAGLEIEKEFKAIRIQPEETTPIAHDFKSGVLNIKATYQGKPCNGGVYVYSIKPRKSIKGKRFYDSADSKPTSFLLTPGRYKVEIKPLNVKGASTKTITIELKAGATLDRSIDL